MTSRRDALLWGCQLGMLLFAPFAGEAQPAGKVYRIGVLLPLGGTPPILGTFLVGMRERSGTSRCGISGRLGPPK